jgi:hypothetical protein
MELSPNFGKRNSALHTQRAGLHRRCFRSALEKALKANGYMKGSLAARIDEAAGDGVITEARRKRAHEDVRVLGNDVLHDEWRSVTDDEVTAAHYVQRILEDFTMTEILWRPCCLRRSELARRKLVPLGSRSTIGEL